MENRILIIGDELFGEQGEVASRAAEMLLCRAPSRPMQFSINSPVPLSIPQLLSRAASDVIGKKAGRIVLGLGVRDLRKDYGTGAETAENYRNLVSELVNKTQSGMFVVTVPVDFFPEALDKADLLNAAIRALETEFSRKNSWKGANLPVACIRNTQNPPLWALRSNRCSCKIVY